MPMSFCSLHIEPFFLPNDISTPVSVVNLRPTQTQIMWSQTGRRRKPKKSQNDQKTSKRGVVHFCVFFCRVLTGNPHGNPRYTTVSQGGPWCTPQETVERPSHGNPRCPVPCFFSPWDPASTREIQREKKRKKKEKLPVFLPRGFPPEFPLQPKVLHTYPRGNLRLMMGSSSRKTCRGGPWDPMGRATGIPARPRGIPWGPVGRPTGSRGVQWVLMGSRGFPREISGSHGKEHNNVNHCRVGNSAS